MKFWGAEVKSGQVFKVEGRDHFILHLSQACLGKVRKHKGNGSSVCLYVRVGDEKHVVGHLFPGKLPHLSFDLSFGQSFELSHSWKNGSVHFIGYAMPVPSKLSCFVTRRGDGSGEEAEGDVQFAFLTDKAKSEMRVKQAKVDEEMDDGEDEEEESSDDYQAVTANREDDRDDEVDESNDEDDEDEETPKKAEVGEKRSAEYTKKTSAHEKKAKFVTPQKTGEKRTVAHVATPHPSKPATKPTAASGQKQHQPQKPFSCSSCGRSFGSDMALQSHTKAKHNGGR